MLPVAPTSLRYLLRNYLQITEPEPRGRWNPDESGWNDTSADADAPVTIGEERDDAMTQSCALDLWAASLPHIDSDVSDDDDDGYCCYYDSREYSTSSGLIASADPSKQTRPGSKPTAILLVHPEPKFSRGKESATLSLLQPIGLD